MKSEKRQSRFNLGLIISLALTLVAFEWKSFSNYITEGDLIRGEDIYEIEDDWIPVFVKYPEPPKPIAHLNNGDIVIIDDIEKDIEEPIKTEVFVPKDKTLIEVPWIEPVLPPEDTPVFGAEVLPKYFGGEKALYKYLYDHIEYSALCRQAGVEGTVYVNFVIEKDGSISSINVVRGIDHCKILNEEVIDAIENMPAWSPAKQGIRTVRFNMTLPVKFTLRP